MSADSQATQDEFARSLGLPFPLVGDPDGSIRSSYDVKWPLVGLARRVTYVIGRDRKIGLAHRAERDVDSHAATACEYVARKKR